jgi:hypothetical protein
MANAVTQPLQCEVCAKPATVVLMADGSRPRCAEHTPPALRLPSESEAERRLLRDAVVERAVDWIEAWRPPYERTTESLSHDELVRAVDALVAWEAEHGG